MEEYKEIFKDVYNYFSKHYPKPRNWDAIIDEGEQIAAKHGKSEFVTKVLIAVWGALESS